MTTVADMVIRETYRGNKSTFPRLTTRSDESVRRAILASRKFVMDESMSGFMADLSTIPFRAATARRSEVLSSLRHGAMLPHPQTWIEYNARAFRRRLLDVAEDNHDVWGKTLVDLEHVPPRIGWLLEEHPKLPHVIRMTEFIDLEQSKSAPKGLTVGNLPFTVVWSCDDNPLPYNDADPKAGMLAHGITPYISPQIAVCLDRGVPPKHSDFYQQVQSIVPGTKDTIETWGTHKLVCEMGGMARYAITLLATLNDIPVLHREVKQQRGYIAKGQYRKFVDHTTVTLHVPIKTDTVKLARRLVVAARRRWHQVRPYWRTHVRPGDDCCASHMWGPIDERNREHCTQCPAWRTWVRVPDGRGDASIGIVTHDFKVTHE